MIAKGLNKWRDKPEVINTTETIPAKYSWTNWWCLKRYAEPMAVTSKPTDWNTWRKRPVSISKWWLAVKWDSRTCPSSKYIGCRPNLKYWPPNRILDSLRSASARLEKQSDVRSVSTETGPTESSLKWPECQGCKVGRAAGPLAFPSTSLLPGRFLLPSNRQLRSENRDWRMSWDDWTEST